jgi:hypothetical protein
MTIARRDLVRQAILTILSQFIAAIDDNDTRLAAYGNMLVPASYRQGELCGTEEGTRLQQRFVSSEIHADGADMLGWR